MTPAGRSSTIRSIILNERPQKMNIHDYAVIKVRIAFLDQAGAQVEYQDWSCDGKDYNGPRGGKGCEHCESCPNRAVPHPSAQWLACKKAFAAFEAENASVGMMTQDILPPFGHRLEMCVYIRSRVKEG